VKKNFGPNIKPIPIKLFVQKISRDGSATIKFNQKLSVPDLTKIKSGKKQKGKQRKLKSSDVFFEDIISVTSSNKDTSVSP